MLLMNLHSIFRASYAPAALLPGESTRLRWPDYYTDLRTPAMAAPADQL